MSSKKYVLFTMIMVLIVVMTLECIGYIFLAFQEGSDLLLAKKPLPDYLYQNVQHPYVGYVINKQKVPHNGNDDEMYNHGFIPSVYNPLEDREDNQYRIAIFGGSVAGQVGNQQLVDSIAREYAFFRGKDIAVFNFGLGGYKQPQQAIALAYMYSIGAAFDAVITIDGFNEVALAEEENVIHGVYPFFPRSWALRVASHYDPELLEAKRTIDRSTQYYKWCRNAHEDGVVTKSAVVRIFIESCMTMANTALQDAQQKAAAKRYNATGDFELSGPEYESSESIELYKDLAGVWYKGSKIMHALAEAHGAQYIHIIQPNQYVDGSKPLSEWEKKHAYMHLHSYRSGVVRGYPQLLSLKHAIENEGIYLKDATQIFAEIEDTIYIDPCCHLNELGKKMLIRFYIEALLEANNSSTKR